MTIVQEVSMSDIVSEFEDDDACICYDRLCRVFKPHQIECWVEREVGYDATVEDVEELFSMERMKDIAEGIASWHRKELSRKDRIELGLILLDDEGNEVIFVEEDPRQMKLFPDMESGLPPYRNKIIVRRASKAVRR